MLTLQNILKQKAFFSISARYTGQHDFYSGNQIGTAAGKGRRGEVYRGPNLPPVIKNFDWGSMGGYTVFNLNAGYKFNERVSLNLGITNIFNARQLEFVGSPYIGRLLMCELKVHFPGNK
jgi:iron complex outermembrane receptor protein